MPEPSIMALVAVLQRHGLTVDTLEDMVHFCERRRTGSVTLHIVDGTISVLEDHGKRKLAAAVDRCLTRD